MTAPASALGTTVLGWSTWGIVIASTAVACGASLALAHHTRLSDVSEPRLLLILVVAVVLGGLAGLVNGLVL
ncbi:hypothetical protein [Rhodococcoides kroppenstedtii]|uniref:hypothetical protein n=1 Tax=Rhodococcoides kroppenstedtii TaxID=293050 RepID=UPI00363E9616